MRIQYALSFRPVHLRSVDRLTYHFVCWVINVMDVLYYYRGKEQVVFSAPFLHCYFIDIEWITIYCIARCLPIISPTVYGYPLLLYLLYRRMAAINHLAVFDGPHWASYPVPPHFSTGGTPWPPPPASCSSTPPASSASAWSRLSLLPGCRPVPWSSSRDRWPPASTPSRAAWPPAGAASLTCPGPRPSLFSRHLERDAQPVLVLYFRIDLGWTGFFRPVWVKTNCVPEVNLKSVVSRKVTWLVLPPRLFTGCLVFRGAAAPLSACEIDKTCGVSRPVKAESMQGKI